MRFYRDPIWYTSTVIVSLTMTLVWGGGLVMLGLVVVSSALVEEIAVSEEIGFGIFGVDAGLWDVCVRLIVALALLGSVLWWGTDLALTVALAVHSVILGLYTGGYLSRFVVRRIISENAEEGAKRVSIAYKQGYLEGSLDQMQRDEDEPSEL